jgi:hypothetical protein
MIKMNITLGMWRFWVVLSVCWVLLLVWDQQRRFLDWDRDFFLNLFGWPIAFLLLGLGIGWVVKGFRRPA